MHNFCKIEYETCVKNVTTIRQSTYYIVVHKNTLLRALKKDSD